MEIANTFFTFLPLLIYFAFFGFVIYAIIATLNAMKQRNEYLREIRNELKKSNQDN